MGAALNIIGCLNGFYVGQAVTILAKAGAFADAASTFAVWYGLPAAAFALVGRGNAGLAIGLALGVIASAG